MAAETSHLHGDVANSEATVRFVLDEQIISARDVAPTTTLLEYLRDGLGRTGTKEGCAEGDCGACTVVLGQLAPDGSRITYKAVNSCIRYLPTVDAHEVITAESLQQGAALHPVQQSMIDQHGSQCGFCTPGFVMSLFSLYLRDAAPQRTEVLDALAGNLCRCTGYRPIIDAGCTMNGYAEPARWSREDSQSPARRDRLRSLRRESTLSLPGFTAPRSLDELADTLARAPDSLILAGGTDVGLWTTKQLRALPPIIYIGEVAELKRIDIEAVALRIGAAVSLTDAWPRLIEVFPALRELAQRFASPPVCNSGTLCGNVANGSPIGDSMPALIALGARIELRHGANVRYLPLEDFYLGYQRKDLQPGEFVVSVSIPLPQPNQQLACYKVSKRFEQDISAVCGAFCFALAEERIVAARIAFGGMAATPKRALHAEAALNGKPWDADSLTAAVAALALDFQPLSDMRASAVYRNQIAANLLRRFYRSTHEHAAEMDVALSIHEVTA